MEQEIQLNAHNKQEYSSIASVNFSPSQNDIIIYQTEDGEIKLDVKMDKETVWLTQAQMSDLFQKDRTVIGRHINNIYKEGELKKNTTCAKFAHMGTKSEQKYKTTLYNLDVIISVGYRVNSKRGTQFRIWANKSIGNLKKIFHEKLISCRLGFITSDFRTYTLSLNVLNF